MIREVTLQERVNKIVKTWITPYLLERGFKKNGQTFSRTLGRLQHLLTIRQESYHKREKISVALRVGVHIPDVRRHFGQHPPMRNPKKLEATAGIVNCAPGLITIPKRAQWWDVTSSDDSERDDAIGRDICDVMVEGGFVRFFDRFLHEREVASFLAKPRSKEDQQMDPYCESMGCAYAGIIWDQLGEYEKCKAAMARAAELARGKRLEADIEKFARDYVPGTLPRVMP